MVSITRFLGAGLMVIFISSCQPAMENDLSNNPESFYQQLGEVVVSIDEFSEASGSLVAASVFAGGEGMPIFPRTSCFALSLWGSCEVSGIRRKRTKNFNSCTLGSFTLTGLVDLEYSGSDCSLSNNGETLKRQPNFNMTSTRGAQVSVEKTGVNGQTLTRISSSSFQFSSDGIRRRVLFQNQTLSDFTTRTTQVLSIAGATRTGRIVNGGQIQVVNNVSGTSCSFVPNSVTWNGSCSCPVSGSWNFTCSDSTSGTLTHSSCGKAELTQAAVTENITFNRCL